MDIYLNYKTEHNLEAIWNFAYQKWREKKPRDKSDKPSMSGIVQKLINDLHEVMVEDGQL